MKFNILTNTEVTEFKADGGKLSSVMARDRGTGETVELSPAAAFVYIGLSPNSDFLKDTVELDRWGFVKTDEGFRRRCRGCSQPATYEVGARSSSRVPGTKVSQRC